MTEYNNCQRIYNVNQGVWHDYGLIKEGIIRFEYEKSILFEIRRNEESYIPYQIKRVVAETKPSNFNERLIRKNDLYNILKINELRREK